MRLEAPKSLVSSMHRARCSAKSPDVSAIDFGGLKVKVTKRNISSSTSSYTSAHLSF
jgi:hypothetical protein